MSEPADNAAADIAVEEKLYYRQFPDWLNRIAYYIATNGTWIVAKIWFGVEIKGRR